MKLNENYILLTDEELFQELQHRFKTMQSLIGEDQESYIRIDYRGDILLLKEVGEDHALVYSYYSVFNDKVEMIGISHPLYRNFLFNMLKGNVEIYNSGAFLFSISQQKHLEGSNCVVEDCRIQDHHFVMIDDRNVWERVPDEREAKDYEWSSFEYESSYRNIRKKFQDQDMFDFDTRDRDGIEYEDWDDIDLIDPDFL